MRMSKEESVPKYQSQTMHSFHSFTFSLFDTTFILSHLILFHFYTFTFPFLSNLAQGTASLRLTLGSFPRLPLVGTTSLKILHHSITHSESHSPLRKDRISYIPLLLGYKVVDCIHT